MIVDTEKEIECYSLMLIFTDTRKQPLALFSGYCMNKSSGGNINTLSFEGFEVLQVCDFYNKQQLINLFSEWFQFGNSKCTILIGDCHRGVFMKVEIMNGTLVSLQKICCQKSTAFTDCIMCLQKGLFSVFYLLF